MMRGQKFEKIQASVTQVFFNFSQNVDNRWWKRSIKRKSLVTEHLREINPCIDIKMPASTTAHALKCHATSCIMHDVAWHWHVNCVRSKDAQKQYAQNVLNLCFECLSLVGLISSCFVCLCSFAFTIIVERRMKAGITS